ncbi:LacI family DNA-binding transcriptional regulator [Coraliomargarita parva]|uniref:LacI family DNA-binding transcriptional regulator n=1 Tax=Coraliomargarita parva TaxID=3014050 RepID=UPI0022B47B94|nr:LacI family DNA-binding transcriptional regulator [Coraliomargarita parva]
MHASKRTVTIRDIAAEVGCSHTTVSLALRNHHKIPEQTREKIRAVAKSLNYEPNPYVQTLLSQVRKGRVEAQRAGLALLTNYTLKRRWKLMPNNNRAIQAAFNRAEELGYRLEEFSLQEPGMNLERLRKVLLARGIRGILVAPTEHDRMQWNVDLSSFSLVSLGQGLEGVSVSTVSHDHAHSMRMVIRRLVAKGFKRVGCALNFEMDNRVGNGWSAHFAHYQMKVPARNRIPLLDRKGLGVQALLKWIDQNKLDAVISNRSADYDDLLKAGIRIPEDLGFACVSILPGRADISGVCQNNHHAGVQSIELIVQMIQNSHFGLPDVPRFIYIPGEWNEGHTLPANAQPG